MGRGNGARVTIRHVGVLAALPAELGAFRGGTDGPSRGPSTLEKNPVVGIGQSSGGGLGRHCWGVDVYAPRLPGIPIHVTSVCSGVGKVAAAHAATVLIAQGIDALFVVGTCGGLTPQEHVGDFVHISETIQWDLVLREGREAASDPALRGLWAALTPGHLGLALTADRPAMRWGARLRRARAVRQRLALGQRSPEGTGDGGPTVAVADMETAAVASVAARAGIPWAGLRVISDAQRSLLARATGRGREASSFATNFNEQAARPAASLEALLRSLSGE